MAHGYLTLPPNPPPLTTPIPQPHFSSSPLPLLAPSLSPSLAFITRYRCVFFLHTVPKIKCALIPADVHSRTRRQPAAAFLPDTSTLPSIPGLCARGFPRFLFYLCTHFVTPAPSLSFLLSDLPPIPSAHHTLLTLLFFFYPPPPLFFCFPKLCTYPIPPNI